MSLLVHIATKHLLARKRQSVVSLMGIVLGVAFFLAISSLMQGSENDFIARLVNNSPHITISDEFRNPRTQPLEQLYNKGAIEIRRVQPLTETRGIRGYEQIMGYLDTIPGLVASPTLDGAALVNSAGKDISVTLSGMIPEEIEKVSTIENYMVEGSIRNIIANPDSVVIGFELARRLSLNMGDNLTIATTTGQVRTFKIAGIFRTGRNNYDRSQIFMSMKRVQALMNRANRANTIIIKLEDPLLARQIADEIETRVGYKATSWQEASEDMMNTLAIRNTIMYTVVSAVLLVAAFGIYNVISTVVLEKQRDIAILKSIGFHAVEIQRIFLIQGIILGVAGCLFGLPLGSGLMAGLMQIEMRVPGSGSPVPMPIEWGWPQFAIAGAFAMAASMLAALLPARKAAQVQPVEIFAWQLMGVLLKAEKLTRRLEGEVPVTLVKNTDVEINHGEFVAITGPSGSGKSSLLYLLGLLDTPNSGRIWLNGREIVHTNQEETADIRLAELGFVFQLHFLLPEFTALENAMLPMQKLGRLTNSQIKNRAEELLVQLDMEKQMYKLPKQLSGGQAQRVAIARALANDPPLIIADEPTGNLDSVSSANVQNILRDLAHRRNHAVVVVTHDPQFADQADRIIKIVDGEIVTA